MCLVGKKAIMLLQKFLKYQQPEFGTAGLYIVKLDAAENDGNTASWRCGRAGTMQFRHNDSSFGSPETRLGMYSRAARYYHSSLPLNMRIFAFLRIKQRLVAREGDRLGGDSAGNTYSINNANQTEVMQKEKLYHSLLRGKGYTDPRFPRSELFQPGRNGLAKLLAVLRSIEGLELYTFSEDDVQLDTTYSGGRPQRFQPELVETDVRQTEGRITKAPSITIRMSQAAIEQLKAGTPAVYERLINIFKAIKKKEDGDAPQFATSYEEIRLSKRMVRALKGDDIQISKAIACAHLAGELGTKRVIEPPTQQQPPQPPPPDFQPIAPAGPAPPSPPPSPSPVNQPPQPPPPPRRSARLNAQLMAIHEDPPGPPEPPPPRRSPRFAPP